ncbi:MAG: asparagine synthase (glutamine-hydrolyzing) [Candidatus Rokubacteria bacterium]|nr:asparagine synthase (glutamine-hydrolyzing) [Candidatus Rokubacteria bacterium]
MCGIAGVVSLNGRPVSAAELFSMCEVMTHRGPDAEGLYTSEGVGLAMRRLSIIDLETGSQPVRNEDGSVWVVLNGEIYNFKTLRRDLKDRGHSFYTATDTETIVHLYEEYGAACVDHLRGMFAFALWDKRRRQALIARDRLGIKPLYYTEVNGRLLFASELKAILQSPDVERRLDWNALGRVFAFLTTPSAESVIAGVRKLEPGHLLIVGEGVTPRPRQYWDVTFEPDRHHGESYFVERLRDLLEESVRLHLTSDVPLGAFLSGGIDSSSVVATMARVAPGPLKTFSIGFREGAYDERPHARRVAERLGIEHRELLVEPAALEVIESLVWHLDEPFGDSSAIPTYLVSKLAAEEVTVVLSGDGGDELFAGYDKYRVEWSERRYGALPAPLRWALATAGGLMPEGMRGRNSLRHFSLDGWQRYLDAVTLFRRHEHARLFAPEAGAMLSGCDPWRDEAECLARAPGGWLAALQYFDLKRYLPLDILTKVDRMSMAHSLEARVPLLDHKLVEFAATIPPEMQLRHGRTKQLLKRAMRGVLADEIIDRPKQGFAVPLAHWFRGPLADFLRDLLLSGRSRQRGIFDPACVETLLEQHRRGRPLDLQLWTLICFEQWCRTFLDRTARPGSRRSPRPTSVLGASGG